MNDPDRWLERALHEPLLAPPDGFAERVRAALPARRPAFAPSTAQGMAMVPDVQPPVAAPPAGLLHRLRLAVLALAGAWALAETAAFVIGSWATVSLALG